MNSDVQLPALAAAVTIDRHLPLLVWLLLLLALTALALTALALIALARRRRRLADEHRARNRRLDEEKERALEIVESITEAFFSVDRNWRFTYLSSRAEELLGRRRADLIGRRLWDEFPEASGSEFEREYQRTMHERSPAHFEARYAPLGRWYEVRAYPTENGIAVYFQDIDQRKHAEESLGATAERLRAVVETAVDGIITIDEAGIIESVNPATEKIFGYAPEELTGKNVKILMPEPYRSEHDEYVRRYVETGEAHIIGTGREVEGRGKDGSVFPLDLAVSEMHLPGRRLFTGIVRDITRQKEAENAVRARERQLRTVLEVLPLPLFIADRSGAITHINKAVREFWGEEIPAAQNLDEYAVYKGWWPASGRRIEPREWALVRAVERGEVIGPEEIEVETFRGERRSILNYARPVRDESGEISGGVAINVDITEAREREEAERFLADAAAILSSSLDYKLTIDRVTHLAVARIADWCIVYVPADEGLERLSVASRDSERETWARALGEEYPPGREHIAYRVLETGESELLPEVPDEVLVATARDERHLSLLRGLGFRSLMVVPMRVRNETLAVIAFGSAESGRRYDESDLRFAERLADRAAVAIENARLFQESERRASEEEALRRAAEALTAALTIDEVVEQIATSALEATGADGAFVERIDFENREAVVVAARGELSPARGSKARYEGSLAQSVMEQASTFVLELTETERWPILHGLTCTNCSIMAVPLLDAGEAIGVLVLIGRPERRRFHDDETARAETFAHLASLAFRRVHLLNESEKRRKEFERVMESRTALIRGFSHDLKNPLTAADGFLRLLEDGSVNAGEQKEFVETARRSLHNALRLIEDLVELARAEAGEMRLEPTAVDLREVAREMTDEYRPQAERKGLALRLTVPSSMPLIEVDPGRVRQILGNLVSNAVKYTQKGEIDLEVGLRKLDDTEWAVISVRDTGSGIAPEKMEMLFREFTRLDPGAAQGAGLGLAISRRIADALGGRIAVDSEVAQGSTFTLWLPKGREPRVALSAEC